MTLIITTFLFSQESSQREVAIRYLPKKAAPWRFALPAGRQVVFLTALASGGTPRVIRLRQLADGGDRFLTLLACKKNYANTPKGKQKF